MGKYGDETSFRCVECGSVINGEDCERIDRTTVRCSECGRPLYYNPENVDGFEVEEPAFNDFDPVNEPYIDGMFSDDLALDEDEEFNDEEYYSSFSKRHLKKAGKSKKKDSDEFPAYEIRKKKDFTKKSGRAFKELTHGNNDD